MSREPRKSQGLGVNSYGTVEKLKEYKIISCIGQGSFGVIHKVERVTDKTVSVRAIDCSQSLTHGNRLGIRHETVGLLEDEPKGSATDVAGSVSTNY
mgnify:CR=1 FL=1